MGGVTVEMILKAVEKAKAGGKPDNLVTIDGRDYYLMDRDALREFVTASAPYAAIGEATMAKKGKSKPKPKPKPRPTGY